MPPFPGMRRPTQGENIFKTCELLPKAPVISSVAHATSLLRPVSMGRTEQVSNPQRLYVARLLSP